MLNTLKLAAFGSVPYYYYFVHRTVSVFMAHGPVDKTWISPPAVHSKT